MRVTLAVCPAAFLLLGLHAPCVGQAKGNRDRRVDIIASVGASFPGDSGTISNEGAGIVLGRNGQTILIATAAHVVTRSPQPSPSDRKSSPSVIAAETVFVVFHVDPSDTVTARLGKYDVAIDIAFLEVPVAFAPFWVDSVVDSEGNPARPGDPVRAIGCAGDCWIVPVTPDHVRDASASLIKFESFIQSSGHSGGALFNADWEVVGLIILKDRLEGFARPIKQVLEIAEQLGGYKSRGFMLLRKRSIPRSGYTEILGFSPLAAFSDTAPFPHGRPPSALVTFQRRYNKDFNWQVSAFRLASSNTSLRGATIGLGLRRGSSRIEASVALEVGVGKTEGRYDAGGYTVFTNQGGRYVEAWRIVEDTRIGFAQTFTASWVVVPRWLVQGRVGHWDFGSLPGVIDHPTWFIGLGLARGL